MKLEAGSDFRLPELREEVFLRFYEHHLTYRSHPGGVYYLMRYLKARLDWNQEQALWYAFLNGNTQHPITSYILFRRFPTMNDADDMLHWFNQNYKRLAFDTDRRYHKKNFELAVRGYIELMRGNQAATWAEAAQNGFSGVWKLATAIPSFGRLSAFSYSEYLRIMGVDFDCDTLLLDDMSGSMSHRNGLAKVLGRDDLDWHKSNPGFIGYTKEIIHDFTDKAEGILYDMKSRSVGKDWAEDVSYFTMESALCTYKSWHRPNRRYANVYNDMLHDRIRQAERDWPEEDLRIFWDARRQYLPRHLRLEDSPFDPGVVPVKQNHYRLTGEVIMMDHEWPEFKNEFNDAVESGLFGVREDYR